jgi:tetratricopeptide (TPR) repeat protein
MMNKKNLAHFFPLFVLILILTMLTSAQGQQGQHSLQGRVRFFDGSAPPNPVKVTLTFNGRRIYETFTDISGRFFFTGLQSGNYQLVAEGDGQTFDTTNIEAEVNAYGSAPQNFTQNIQLRPKAGKAVSPAAVTSVEAVDPNLPARAREEYDKGIKDAGNNKPENAIKHLQEAITVHPQFYSAHVAIAEQYTKLKRDAEAVEAYQKAIEMKPDRAPAYVGLGMIFVKQKKYSEAITPLRRSLEINKQSSAPFMFLGLAEMMTGDYQSSEANLLRAYDIGKPALVRMYLANLYDLKGEPAKAIEQLQAFLKESNLPQERQIEIREVIEKLKKQMANKK